MLWSFFGFFCSPSNVVTNTDHGPHFKLTIVTPYLTLTGELWGVGCKEFEENTLRYNGTALYNAVEYVKGLSVDFEKQWN